MSDNLNDSLIIWRAYCDKKMELEEAKDRIEQLEAVLQRIANLETKWFPSKQHLLMEMIQEAKSVLENKQ